jgi:hypothetical protein
MTNYTQLHLGNKSPEPSQREQARKELSKQRVLFGSSLLAVTVLSGIFLLITNGCSKGPAKAAGQNSSNPNAPMAQSTTPPAPAVAAVVLADTKPAKKRVVQRKAPTATFVDPINGISFRYPKSYILKTGDEPARDLSGMGPLQMDFVQPGGATVAAIELPRNSYPGTDVSSAFFSVSVNPELTALECDQFAFPLSLHPETDPGAPSKAKVGGTEFRMVEDFGVTDQKEPHMKYYHRFENGSCYEFGMGLSISAEAGEDVKPINREQVFKKLEQILATVKVEQGEVPEVAKGTTHPIVEGSKE